MFPPFITNLLANVCRSTCDDRLGGTGSFDLSLIKAVQAVAELAMQYEMAMYQLFQFG